METGAKQGEFARDAGAAGARSGPGLRPSSDAAVSKPSVAGRILVVEDQEDVRRMVATALEIEGYHVDEAANAQEGLQQLSQRHYHLVLSDYAMPGETGTWMLQEAGRRGLMDRTAAMIVTAHPDVRELADVAVINKPLDLDYFLEQIRTILASSPAVDELPRAKPAEDKPVKADLILYISSTSSTSIQARRNLDRLIGGFDASQIKCTVVDLVEDPLAGEADRIAFTPTLVKRHPGPRTWVLGNLRNHQILIDLLQTCGVSAARR
jgi:CheY-like chemotaxis protein